MVNLKETMGVILIFAILGILVLFSSIYIVTDGEVGVKKTLGNYNDNELGTGVHFALPIISHIERVNVKQVTVDETATVPASDGLIVTLDTSVLYEIRGERASEIRQTISGDIRNTKITPYIRNGIRDIVSGYSASVVYSQIGREEVGQKLKVFLEEKIGNDIKVIDVLLRDVTLPAKVTAAIEEKLDKQQQSQAKEFELIAAKKDAEIEIARAKGIAEANEIISGSITDKYLQYRFIEGLNDGNTEVIYVPTETNLPILEAGRFNKLNKEIIN